MEEQTQGNTNRPSHIAYLVKQGAERAFWTEIGVAWPHKDGCGLRLKLDAVPVGGVVELRLNEPSARKEFGQSGSGPVESQ